MKSINRLNLGCRAITTGKKLAKPQKMKYLHWVEPDVWQYVKPQVMVSDLTSCMTFICELCHLTVICWIATVGIRWSRIQHVCMWHFRSLVMGHTLTHSDIILDMGKILLPRHSRLIAISIIVQAGRR